MEKEYVSIKEFAELAGVSAQSVYQKIRKKYNPIQVYLKKVDNKTLIRKTALKDLYSAGRQQEEIKEPTERLLDIFEKQLAEKDKQLAEKDRQIEGLLKNIDDMQRLLDQQQKLKAMETQLLIEDGEQQREVKKGFFSRFFN